MEEERENRTASKLQGGGGQGSVGNVEGVVKNIAVLN